MLHGNPHLDTSYSAYGVEISPRLHQYKGGQLTGTIQWEIDVNTQNVAYMCMCTLALSPRLLPVFLRATLKNLGARLHVHVHVYCMYSCSNA